jgi:hypothetical protein
MLRTIELDAVIALLKIVELKHPKPDGRLQVTRKNQLVTSVVLDQNMPVNC